MSENYTLRTTAVEEGEPPEPQPGTIILTGLWTIISDPLSAGMAVGLNAQEAVSLSRPLPSLALALLFVWQFLNLQPH